MNRQLPIPLFAQTGRHRLITEWDYDNYGTVKRYRQANDWNPSGNPSMWLNDRDSVASSTGAIVVGSGDDESMVQTLSNLNAAPDELHNGCFTVSSREPVDDPTIPRSSRPRSLGNDARVGRPVVLVGVVGVDYDAPGGTGISNLDASEWNPLHPRCARLARNHSPSAPSPRIVVFRWRTPPDALPARAEVCNVCVSPNASEHIQVAGRCRYNHEG